MVPAELLRAAVDKLHKYSTSAATSFGWVNWRGGYQIKVNWYDNESFVCYLDFGKDRSARDTVLRKAFEAYSRPGQEPRIIDGHGWSAMDYSFFSSTFISLDELAEIASGAKCDFSILYVQEDISSRPLFTDMGIPLVPGEMGKEWINGAFEPYSRTSAACL